ncbi:HDOD domain-containing protein [Marinospirillum insulare]|uniref:HDOD domain-containing protein n=1 Tax=Marinospirillum insulare TaxID=217169 RepID=A0ABQ6A510_9GAMM|nr:HDOD domain-containing protein [Marinospirillum insulare]GLR65283.1 hypothetical protein GCM10007878_27220 [Marinospirillum insulare]
MKLSDLHQFEQFSQLTDEQLILLKPSMRIKRCEAADETILPLGSSSDLEFFLLNGKVNLVAEDGREQEIKAGTPEARLSIARLRPSIYQVNSASAAVLIALPGKLLTQQVKASIIANFDGLELSTKAQIFYNRLKTALEDKKFTLPSLPSVALKVRKVLEQEEPEIAELEKLLNHDPSISAKLVAAANSPLYHRGSHCKTSADAIMRLGLETTSQLVMLFSLRQLFKAKQAWVKKRMVETWTQGVRVAAICQLLTLHHSHLSGDQALLIGLIHNLGELAILKFMDQQGELDPKEMEPLLEELMPEAGGLLLSSWNFDEEIITSIRQINTWQTTEDNPKATLDDLLKVARLHSLKGTDDQYRYPRLDELPAFRKLAKQGLTEDFSLALVEDAAEQVAETQAMFGL